MSFDIEDRENQDYVWGDSLKCVHCKIRFRRDHRMEKILAITCLTEDDTVVLFDKKEGE